MPTKITIEKGVDNDDLESKINLDLFNLLNNSDNCEKDTIEFLESSDQFNKIIVSKNNEIFKNNEIGKTAKDDTFEYKIEYLDKTLEINEILLQKTIDEFIVNSLSFQRIELKGIKVKGRDGKKFYPTIYIYVKRNIYFILPKILEFIKGTHSVENKGKWSVKSDSKILNSLIGNQDLYFINPNDKTNKTNKTNKTLYKLFISSNLKSSIELWAQEPKSNVINDFLTMRLQKNIIEPILNKLSFINKINKNDGGESFFFWVDKELKFIIKLINKCHKFSKNDIEILFNLVENTPNINNYFDYNIKLIEKFLIYKGIVKNETVGDYMEGMEIRIPTNKSKNTIRYFKENK